MRDLQTQVFAKRDGEMFPACVESVQRSRTAAETSRHHGGLIKGH